MANVKYTKSVSRDFRYHVPRELRLAVMDVIRKWAMHPREATTDEVTVLTVPPNAYLKYTPSFDGIVFAISFIYPWGDVAEDIFRITGLSSNSYKRADSESDGGYLVEEAKVYDIAVDD